GQYRSFHCVHLLDSLQIYDGFGKMRSYFTTILGNCGLPKPTYGPGQSVILSLFAFSIASVLPFTSILEYRLYRWVLTVLVERYRFSAISLLLCPLAKSCRTSYYRLLKFSSSNKLLSRTDTIGTSFSTTTVFTFGLMSSLANEILRRVKKRAINPI